jgi:hypothetical protein
VRDHNGLAVAYVYFESEPGRRAAANLLTKDEARRIAANIAQLPGLLGAARPQSKRQSHGMIRNRGSATEGGWGARDSPSDS